MVARRKPGTAWTPRLDQVTGEYRASVRLPGGHVQDRASKPLNIQPRQMIATSSVAEPTSPSTRPEVRKMRGQREALAETEGPAEAGPVCADLQVALCRLCYWLCSVVTVFSKRSLCCAVKLFENWRT